ncbi:selenite/tellurite reduction operon rhodanese-like protein ExtH [Natranaeroarchaeum sulfidigenes]|uniref:Rhodanese-related sulfurtransferase n=1 Tax=Natranaeroarchaeum sulfidigenes TaxID=2784880 RepID=A0A897MJD5_9EURY|nr:selenite/tellurite reduction operon rhodanese-like protein ExtH [Natranaeroarchaeum sulfidigenes]QSG02210.1 Rhodanese-related sulfurtransferase [Natranaeroarchaeum sulfidigenes]
MDRKLDRRRFVQITGAAGLGALAGCLGDDEPASENEEENGTENGDESANGEEEEETQEDVPDPTATENALIEPATLKEWHDVGLVNLQELDVRDRVTVLRVWDTETYEDGHVPGALKWAPDEFHAARVEGLGEAAPMVPDGAQMDEVLQRSGVCPRTTIVLSGPSALRTARAYWTLRYWGFPRERIKVLNGGYNAYGEKYELETGGEPDAPAATFSVEANDELNNEDRLGIAQMIQRVDLKQKGEREDVLLDNRADPDATISTAIIDDPANYHEGDSYSTKFAEGGHWKDADELESHIFDLDGVAEGDTIVTFCGSGYRATMGYFVLDGLLGYDDVTVYDGSFSRQWAQYDGNNTEGNVPPEEWRVDLNDRTEGDTGESELEIVVDEIPDLDSADANQIESTDAAYMAGEDTESDDGDGDDEGGDWGCD